LKSSATASARVRGQIPARLLDPIVSNTKCLLTTER
jgi:hypothetical protein